MLARFPRLQARLREEVEGLLERERSATIHKLEELVSMEEAYIYTDDEKFIGELQVRWRWLPMAADGRRWLLMAADGC